MRSLKGLHPDLRDAAEAAVAWAEQQGVTVQITSVTRTWAEQQKLYANYLACKRAGASRAPALSHLATIASTLPTPLANQRTTTASPGTALSLTNSCPGG